MERRSMKWKTVVLAAAGATLGTVGVHTYVNGFNPTLTLAVGLASLLGALLLGYVATLGKRR